MRVQGWQTPVRNESDSGFQNPPASIPRENGLSVSIYAGTRKVSYRTGVDSIFATDLIDDAPTHTTCISPQPCLTLESTDGELCLNRVKPGETLVEARSDSDVQIHHYEAWSFVQ